VPPPSCRSEGDEASSLIERVERTGCEAAAVHLVEETGDARWVLAGDLCQILLTRSPPLQKPGSYNLEQVMAQVKEMSNKHPSQ